MGTVHANIQLINQTDLSDVRRGLRKKEEVREVQVNALVDSGAYFLAINDDIRTQLGLFPSNATEPAVLANGQIIHLEVVGPIEVRYLNRRCVVEALVLPGEKTDVLLGVIPLEAMDLIIDPREQKLTTPPTRPNYAVHLLK